MKQIWLAMEKLASASNQLKTLKMAYICIFKIRPLKVIKDPMSNWSNCRMHHLPLPIRVNIAWNMRAKDDIYGGSE